MNTLKITGFFLFLIATVYCNWICPNGNDYVQITDGNTLESKAEEFVMCKYKPHELQTTGNHYYEYTVEQKAVAVCFGLSMETDDEEGINGIYYGDAQSGCLRSIENFPIEKIENGDKIGFLTEETDDELKVYIYLNKHSLGLAFQIPRPEKPLYPYVKSNSLYKVKFEEFQDKPENKEMEANPAAEGVYKIVSYTDDDETVNECNEDCQQIKAHFQIRHPRHYALDTEVSSIQPTLYWVEFQIQDFEKLCILTATDDKWNTIDCYDYSEANLTGEFQTIYSLLDDLLENSPEFNFDTENNQITLSTTEGDQQITFQKTAGFTYTTQTESPFVKSLSE